ncbi:MAG: hypothetical protein ACR2GK_08815 [Gemmatimonadaceae bacterium]
MLKPIAATLAALALGAVTAGAQATDGPDPLELGVDAGITIGFGDNSRTSIDIPVSSARVGFPIGRRTSLEPKFRINVTTGDGDTFTSYRAEMGLLYHLGSSRYPGAYHRAGMYVRPFLGVSGFSNGASSSSSLVGFGFGFKQPIVSRLSSRFEANVAQHFGDRDGAELGLLAGLSFFTR